MKTTRYRFEQAIQEVREDREEWLRGEFRDIFESDKDFTRKADYIGFSILSLDAKVASLDEEIKELQQIKKELKIAKTITLSIGAEVIAEYGIDKIEGAGISSITVTPSSSKTVPVVDDITNEEALLDAGYFVRELNEDKIISDYRAGHNKEFIKRHCSVFCRTVIKLPLLKVNKRRSSSKRNMEVAV